MTKIEKIHKLQETLAMDGLSFKELEKFCLTNYRLNFNPLPGLRKYIERNRLEIPIHYIETDHEFSKKDILNRMDGRTMPIISVITKKENAIPINVSMYLITGNSWESAELKSF